MSKKRFVETLETEFEGKLKNIEIPFAEYPRPQLKRDSYICLNGEWDFKIINSNEERYNGVIKVPFPVESRISGVGIEIFPQDILEYSRTFILPKDFLKDKLIIHFGAVDQYCKVFLNDKFVGENTGGYLPFSFDITEFLVDGENKLNIQVKDSLDKDLPYGKQSEKPKGMWYTKVSGIWQTVWLESVPDNYVKGIKITPTLNSVKIHCDAVGEKNITIAVGDGELLKTFSENETEIEIENPIYWDPENPFLYNFVLTVGEDRVESYFALRTIDIRKVNGREYICLNGKPYFFNGILDQGYFSDGIFLPATEEGFKNDIIKMKSLGFNTLRKHIKLEPELFYYYCDKYGMIVFQDFINSGKYSFFIDTAMPNIIPLFKVNHKATPTRQAEFIKTAVGIMQSLYNHPSVCYYTIFNEGWGQFDADRMYNYFKPIDKTRIFDTTSGWFKSRLSDVESKHIYFKKIKLKSLQKPLVLSEFGGYSYKVQNHTFNLKNNYGYGSLKTQQDFEKAFVNLYEQQVIPQIKNGLNATVYTQVSDVEDETNGLLTYDRKVLKVSREILNNLFEKLNVEFKKALDTN